MLRDFWWHSRSSVGGVFRSVAQGHQELVFLAHDGQCYVTLRRPETKPTLADCPSDGEWLGVRLPVGAYCPIVKQAAALVDNQIVLPNAPNSFWLHGSVWEFPTMENLDVFAKCLIREDLIRPDPIVREVLAQGDTPLTLRSVQRRFVHIMGLSPIALRQIERAQMAARRLVLGHSIADVTFDLGFYGQAHFT
ncbi:MAG: helix-turn-helix domain-containing protein [Chloroflexi bacterium]|nr:helix-turn-helix domain-containing protein [Chloroflexota bacterium]